MDHAAKTRCPPRLVSLMTPKGGDGDEVTRGCFRILPTSSASTTSDELSIGVEEDDPTNSDGTSDSSRARA
eukprot:2667907-Pleurochrysis_carterae.AAC.1